MLSENHQYLKFSELRDKHLQNNSIVNDSYMQQRLSDSIFCGLFSDRTNCSSNLFIRRLQT
jgi:hypothetical protein